MDLTNARSMELFRKIGLADELRKQGVDPDIDQDVLMSTGMERDHILTKWELPGVNKFRARIREQNDGSQPREPWQRISQAIFEKWLKNICDQDPLVDLRFAWKVISVVESPDQVLTTVEAPDGETHVFSSSYVAGCDGGSSTVRRSLKIPIDGGPMSEHIHDSCHGPSLMLLADPFAQCSYTSSHRIFDVYTNTGVFGIFY
jgi:FAD-dependent monooxygenase